MNASLANSNGSMFGAGVDFSAASDAGCAIALRTLGAFGGGLALVAMLAGLFGN